MQFSDENERLAHPLVGKIPFLIWQNYLQEKLPNIRVNKNDSDTKILEILQPLLNFDTYNMVILFIQPYLTYRDFIAQIHYALNVPVTSHIKLPTSARLFFLLLNKYYIVLIKNFINCGTPNFQISSNCSCTHFFINVQAANFRSINRWFASTTNPFGFRFS
jgi:hypothetical protein